MGYREDMERCRQYIDEHLDEEIEIRDLSRMFGYSFHHFCHVFSSCNEMPVGEYLRDRRLCRAAVELARGRSVTQTGLDCGFETPSGFTRAFYRRFGQSPSEYKKHKGGRLHMKPEFIKKEAFIAIGYVLKPKGKIDAMENGAYWFEKDFSSVSREEYGKMLAPGYAEVGAWIQPQDGTEELCYFLGATVLDKSCIPEGLEVLDIPQAEYAVFPVARAHSAQDLHDAVKKTWKYVFNDWFDTSGYRYDQGKIGFEYYLDKDTYVYIPVVKP